MVCEPTSIRNRNARLPHPNYRIATISPTMKCRPNWMGLGVYSDNRLYRRTLVFEECFLRRGAVGSCHYMGCRWCQIIIVIFASVVDLLHLVCPGVWVQSRGNKWRPPSAIKTMQKARGWSLNRNVCRHSAWCGCVPSFAWISYPLVGLWRELSG